MTCIIVIYIYLGLLFLSCNFSTVFVAFQEPHDTADTLPSQQFVCMVFLYVSANFCVGAYKHDVVQIGTYIQKMPICYKYVFFCLYSIRSSIIKSGY